MREWIRRRPALLAASIWIAPAILAMVQQVLAGPARRLAAAARCATCCSAGGDWLVYAVLTPPIFASAPLADRRRPRPAGASSCTWPSRCSSASPGRVGKLLQLMLGLLHRPARARAGAGRSRLDRTGSWSRSRSASSSTSASPASRTRSATSSRPREREMQLARLSEQLAGARLAALQAQLNPHFLFNSLNTIAVLVARRRHGRAARDDRAIERRAAEHARPRIAPTKCRSTTNWSWCGSTSPSSRRGSPIGCGRRSTIDAGARCRPRCRSFALQHLVENAIRHGIARRSDAGASPSRARRDGDMLEVSVRTTGRASRAQARCRRWTWTREHARTAARAVRRSRVAARRAGAPPGHDRHPAHAVSRDRTGGRAWRR